MTTRRLPLLGVARILAALSAVGSVACTDTIVADGRPTASIITPDRAAPEVLRAARELQSYVLKTTGAELPIRNDSEARTEPVEIRIAVSPIGPVRDGDSTSQITHEDGYAIESAGRRITILGGSPRGALYGAYAFIERVLDVRWFMPTDLGEDIVPRRTVAVPVLSMVRNPAFPNVSGFSWVGSPGAEDWELRMRAKVGRKVSFGHNWHNIYPFSKESFEKNPEMFALFAGRRGASPQLCTSNPDVVRVSVEAARRAFKADPDLPLFSISPNDGTGFCECERCRKIDALYGVTDGSITDRLVHYANEVLAEVEKTNPGKQLGIYAYAEYTSPPKKARPRPGYATSLTHMPWEFCHVHSVDDPACPSNVRFLRYLKDWSKATSHTGVYEYYGHFFAFTPWPIVHSMRRDIPLFKSLGVERFISETQQNWANQGVNFYVAAKLVEDPGRDVDALLAEYFDRFYGKAGPAMRRYFDLWESAITTTSAAGDRGYAWLSMFTPELVTKADLILREAEATARKDARKFERRVAFARVGFGFTEAYALMLDAGLRNDPAGVDRWLEECLTRLRATAGSTPQAFYVDLALDQTRYVARILSRGVAPWIALQPMPVVEPASSPSPSPAPRAPTTP